MVALKVHHVLLVLCTFLHGKCAEGGVSDELFVAVYILHSIGFVNRAFSLLMATAVVIPNAG